MNSNKFRNLWKNRSQRSQSLSTVRIARLAGRAPSARFDDLAASEVGLTAPRQTSMLVCRGEVREFGLTGLTRNQVSLTAPGVRIPPSPPHPLADLGDDDGHS